MTLRPMIAALAIAFAASSAGAQPSFINGITIAGETLDKTREPGANAGRLGFFSDLYYDPARKHWWVGAVRPRTRRRRVRLSDPGAES